MSGVIVTGATGFIGRHLVRSLTAEGERVTVLHRRQSAGSPVLEELSARGAIIEVYSNYRELLEIAAMSAPETVFHLATHYVREHDASMIHELIDANITSGTYLLEAMVGSSCTVVTAMSYFQFKNGVASPFSLYSATKQAFMEVTGFYRESKQLDVRNVVLFDTYGPGDTRDKIIPRLLKAAASGEHLRLGPSTQPINFLYVSDVIDGLRRAAAPMQPAIMSLRATHETSLGELVAVLEGISGREISKVYDESQPVSLLVKESGEWAAPAGWTPVVELDEGIRRSWNEIRATEGR